MTSKVNFIHYSVCMTSKFGYELTVPYIQFWVSAMLPFANTKICLFLLRHICKERKRHMTKVAKQNSNTSKEFINQIKSQTVSL